MAVTSALLSVEEFSRLPQPSGGVRQELHHGEVVELPPVKLLHTLIQRRIVELLQSALKSTEFAVDKEFPFRPIAEYEVWVADVAISSWAICKQSAYDDYYRGVPAIVVEVLSPSNTASEMLSREQVCLRNGGHEFWLVDPESMSVKISLANGYSIVHDRDGAIESALLNGPIAVRDVFAI